MRRRVAFFLQKQTVRILLIAGAAALRRAMRKYRLEVRRRENR